MKINRLILCIFCLFISYTALASQANNDLRNQISAFIESYDEELTAKGYRLEYEIGSIDPRLSIGQCEENLNLEFIRNPIEQSHNTIKLSCDNGHPWKLFVSATLNIYGQVVTADAPIARGQLVTLNEIRMQESLINRSREIMHDDPDQVIGKIAKRTIRAGQTLSPRHLKAPNLVSRGDQVMIIAKNQSISIKTNGTALSHGALGQQINVKNNKSERIVKAKVVDRGRVLITM